jgi:hypothetical protein
VILLTVALVVAACSDGGGGGHPVLSSGTRSASASTTAPSSGTLVPPTTSLAPTTSPSPTTSPPLDQPGWTVVSYGVLGVAIDQRTVTNADGSQITVARFHAGQVRFALHVGSQDPPMGAAIVGSEAGSSVTTTEGELLLAAFNGGFKVASGSGGFEVDNQVLRPLMAGRASFVIDTDGSGHIGVWGQSVPAPGERVLSVRQNLQPLITGAQLSPQITTISAWGSTFGNESAPARSSLGVDAQGDIVYAASMSALPVDLGDALLAVGAVTAMQLDINPEWVQLALAPSAGGPLVAGVPGQHRPADQYLVGWTRDFVTVLAI